MSKLTEEINNLLQTFKKLRDPSQGCPWDKEQDFKSIASCSIEEAYEVADAIEREDFNDLKEELVLANAEAAQNIVKHAYKGVENTTDHMQIKISLKENNLEIGFFDKGKPVVAENIQHRKLDDIKPGGLGTFFIKQIIY